MSARCRFGFWPDGALVPPGVNNRCYRLAYLCREVPDGGGRIRMKGNKRMDTAAKMGFLFAAPAVLYMLVFIG